MDNEGLNALLIKRLMLKSNLHSLDYKTMDTLSSILNNTYSISVSASTLSRLSGLRKDKTQKAFGYTLDSLAKAADFISYEQFKSIVYAKESLLLHNKVEIEIPFITLYTEKAARENDIQYLESLSKYVADSGCAIDTYNLLGGALLKGLRANKCPEKVLEFMASTPIMIDVFFESFVDTDYFVSYFGEGMIHLSKRINTINRTYLFANSIAMLYEQKKGLKNAYQKRAQKLAAIDFAFLDYLLSEKCVYPVARWMQVMLEFWLTKNDSTKSASIFDYAVNHMNKLSSDNTIIIISQLSEVGKIMPENYIHKLKSLYELKSGTVFYEYDSLVNAGLNLSLLLDNKGLIKKNTVETLMKQNPYQFITCIESIKQKMAKVYL